MTQTRTVVSLLVVIIAAGVVAAQAPPATAVVTVKNPIDLARPAETIVLGSADLKAALNIDDLRRVYVRDAGGRDVLAQAVDLNDDGTFDELVFQIDLAPAQSAALTLTVGDRRVYTAGQFKAYGRFVRERRDDFAWENDRVAHRMYGAALETWKQEPLTSSAVDVWFKRTRRLVINEWYMVDDYHRDLGDGADLYSAGRTRGCGGSGVWEAGRLWTSANFRDTRVLANGPIRVTFELRYQAWDVNGRPVRETKRITLDAGHRLSRFESEYTGDGWAPSQFAAGIKKVPAATATVDRAAGILRTWEPVRDQWGSFGCAVVMAPATVADAVEADGNTLLVGRAGPDGRAVYYAGADWSHGGDSPDNAAWGAALAAVARRLQNPVQVVWGTR
jgi:hypothetical protein